VRLVTRQRHTAVAGGLHDLLGDEPPALADLGRRRRELAPLEGGGGRRPHPRVAGGAGDGHHRQKRYRDGGPGAQHRPSIPCPEGAGRAAAGRPMTHRPTGAEGQSLSIM
jgi:hypothetical protein